MYALIAVLLLALSVFSASNAFAQIAQPQGGGGTIGTSDGTPRGASAGTMIAAVMESVGYHGQAQILSNLSNLLETAGALIFVGVVLSSIISVTVFGRYQPALWMLIGPPVFFFVSGISVPGIEAVRAEASGAEWRFGNFHDTEGVKDRYTPTPVENASVSFVFHKFNELISEISQYTINVITSQDISKQMIFSARQRTVESLFGERIRDAGVLSLAAHFMVHCNTEIGDARTMAIFKREVESGIRTKAAAERHPTYQAAKARYCARFPEPNKILPRGPALNFVYSLPAEHRADVHFPVTEGEHRESLATEDVNVSCEEMWRWTIVGTMNETKSSMENWARNNFPWYSWKIFDSRLWNQTLDDLIEKYIEDDPAADGSETLEDPCPMAIGVKMGDDAHDAILKMTSSLMLRKTMTDPGLQRLYARVMNDHSGVAPVENAAKILSTNPDSRRSQLERQAASKYAEGRRYEAYAFIHWVPYMQGFLLYVLAVLYPFFALLIIVPGQAGQFFTWMALWTWVKSWDVGWALIMVADEILWELMPKHGYFNPDNEEAFSTPINLLEGAYAGDPAYSIAFYWTLLATMIFAVPIITAQILLGAKRALAGRLFDGASSIKGWSENFGESAALYVASSQVGQYTRQTAQTSTLAQLQRGMPHSEKMRDQADKVDDGNDGLIGQHMMKTQDNIKTNADAVLGPQAASAGSTLQGWGDSAKQNGVPGGELLSSAGSWLSSYGEGAQERVESASAPGGREDQEVKSSGQATNNYGNARIFPAIAKMNSAAANTLYGGNPNDRTIDAISQERVSEGVLRQAGIEPELFESFVSDDTTNQLLNEATRLSLIRRGYGGFAQTDAEAMTAMSIMTAMAGGPSGLNTQTLFTQSLNMPLLVRNMNYASNQSAIGYDIMKEQTRLSAQIQYNMFDHHAYESTYDPRYQLQSEAEAYLSSNRGGEFFAIATYDAELAYHMPKALMSTENQWAQQQSQLWGNSARWAFQPIIFMAARGFGSTED